MNEGIIVASLSTLTVLIAWIFRYKIAELAKGRTKAPQEVLFEGYEELLKTYKETNRDQHAKILQLEKNVGKLQNDLNAASQTIQQMKIEDARKAGVIDELQLKLEELKAIHKRNATP